MTWVKGTGGYQYVVLEDPSVTIESAGGGSNWSVVTKKDGTQKAVLSSGWVSQGDALAEMDRLMSQVGYVS